MRHRWRRGALAGALAFAAARAAHAAAPPPGALFTSAASFNSTDHIVSTTVFHWFGANDGQVSGPWRPLGGRATWDGSVDFFKRQIKDIMDANVQVMYCHLMGDPAHEQKQVNLFQAAAELRAQAAASASAPAVPAASNARDTSTAPALAKALRHRCRILRCTLS